ncbi:hypothetical protein D3C86_2074250 [compost metagenome]
MMVGGQRLLIDNRRAVGIDLSQLDRHRRVHRVLGDKPSRRPGCHPPQLGFGQITTQARALFDHPGQGVLG